MALCREVFLEFEAPDYPPEGTENFLAFLEPKQISRMTESGLLTFFGAYRDGLLIGAGAVKERNHICLLFIRKEFHRQGAGALLLDAMLKFCRKSGAEKATVNASPYGVPFYQAKGFQKLGEEQCRDGIRFVPMERNLL
ncbi:MAG TPA: GNAT family N-acetyltransferase [Candidatus Merdivicinus excrementipullorum]|uniref:GNAT family N-acetyltransferase n=1 Tax=Candidatus Merdivicinus excrementipullorum TaxID=2840867 RepID=A0A9D1FM42_9FIRM|nr:GNAT family N-acetyltransferase [Candidatus Merdivicinus excrementipullorum]